MLVTDCQTRNPVHLFCTFLEKCGEKVNRLPTRRSRNKTIVAAAAPAP